MSKSSIDNIISDKLQNINFSFKAEYWDKMHEKLDTECTKTNTCNSGGVSGFFIGSIIISLLSIIGIITYFTWEVDESSDLATPNSINIESIESDNIKTIEATSYSNPTKIESSSINKETIQETEAPAEKSVKSSKKYKRKKSVAKKAKTSQKKKTIIIEESITDNETEQIENKQSLKENDLVSDTLISIELEETNNLVKPTSEQSNLQGDNDSIVINDSKILNNQGRVKEKDKQVIVQAKPIPVKHVKTRSKPNKRVFKRKGFLYRLGLRK
ncbi:MAG: hypothetical protein KAG64_02525 [Bacteroidales bacterium]|nr:hypothetical protein [Bacteroidales bacterium]